MWLIRERLVRERRRRRLRLLRLFVFLAALCFACVWAWKALHRPGFAFGELRVTGTRLVTAEELIEASGGGRPFNFFNASFARIEDALATDARFKNAKVRYRWPATVEVSVVERQTALYVASAYGSYLKVDFEGVVLSSVAGIPDAGAPVLSGVECGNAFVGDRLTEGTALAALEFLSLIERDAREAVAEIAADEKGDVRLLLKDSFPVILGPAGRIREKARLFMSVFREIKGKDIRAAFIDLTYGKPYIRLEPKEGAGAEPGLEGKQDKPKGI